MSDETIKINISRNIQKYREQSGMSQKEFAKKLGVAPSRVSNWETYANCPSIDILFDVCDVLGVSINDIYGIYPDSNFTLSFDEQSMIKKYRDLDSHGREMVDFTLLKEWERSVSNKEKDNVILMETTNYTTNAAHADDYASAPDELKKQEEDIMDDENF